LLSRVRAVCLDAQEHQDLPFEKLVQELQPERDQSRNPLFQVMFALQNATRGISPLEGMRIEPIEFETGRSLFDLSLFLRERNGTFIGQLEYSTDLFDRDTIERLAGYYRRLLEFVVADPAESIAALPILSEAERHKILVEWNDTAADYPKDKCIQQLFEEQVERTPEAIALEFEDQQITYRELNSRANQLAHYLVTLGIGPEKLVGICVERSIEMLVGLLGTLKAGGAYVPLDPAYPHERLRFMLEDSRVSFILTEQKLIEDREWTMGDGDRQFLRISSTFNPPQQIVCLDQDAPDIEQQGTDNPSREIGSRNLAYVIYTSGSTGKPKGVQIEHRSVVNCVLSIGKQIEVKPQDAWLAVTTISFDIAALDFFLPLISGARLVLANAEESGDATRLGARVKTSQANVMQATPSMWQLLFELGWQFPTGFTILSGGEALTRGLADRFLGGTDSVWNLYGPTESTIWSTTARVTANEDSVPIGRPIANTQVYILDSNLQPVPIGVTGELYVGGDGLARDYLNQPEMTAEKFVRNPFNEDPDSRLYRTGDLAKYRADGSIEFLGRCDNQVKFRGYRIELGEIEAVLNQHPAVKDAVVVVRGDMTEEESRADNSKSEIENPELTPRLVAYVVPNEEQASINELRGVLKKNLPEYMIPSSFVVLEALPLTPNGKADRNKLPPPDGARPLTREFVPPRTEIEELITQIWREILKIENLGIHDNFFEVGGHSLLAAQIVARLQDAFNKDIPLRLLFDAPTIAELAQELNRIIRDGPAPELPPIVSIPHDGPLPLSLNQEQLWRLDQMIPGMHLFNMPYVYRLSGDLNIGALERSLTEIIRRHEALRTVFVSVVGHPSQFIQHVFDFQLRFIDLRSMTPRDREEKAASLILEEKALPFDLTVAPLMRTKLLRLTDNDYLLLVTVHHIISDHWSMQVFRTELAALYEAFCQGKPSPLRNLPIQFCDFASWERGSGNIEFMQAQLASWKRQLAGPLRNLEFKRGSRGFSYRTASIPIEIHDKLFARIRDLNRKENSTSFMVLLSALNIVLHDYTGQQDIRIGTLVANRSRRETEGLIGHFINTVILRTQLSPNMTYKELLRDVREVALDAYAHQELPFEQLARVIEQEQLVDRSSLIQLMFIYQNLASQYVSLPGLILAPLEMKYTAGESGPTLTAFDLIVNLRESSTKLTGTVNYKTDIFDEQLVSEMIYGFNKARKIFL
jgi:amino acid adenylation domain-containing protein